MPATVHTAVVGLPHPLVEPKRGYRFAPENETLVELALPPARAILDLGAGCGVLGLLAAYKQGAENTRVTFVERNRELAQICRINAAPLGACAEVIEADLRGGPEGVDARGYDLVVMNPPFFVPGHGRPSRHESVREATHAYHGDITDFVACGARALRDDAARLVALYPADQLIDALAAFAQEGLYVYDIMALHARHLGRAYRTWVVGGRAPGALTVTCATLVTLRADHPRAPRS